MPVNPAAAARLAASPETVKQLQRWLGLPESGQWDGPTADALEAFQTSKGWDADFGMTGNATDWNTLTSALSLRAPEGPNPAMEDPQYAAFLRTSGVTTANIKNEILARIEQANSERNRSAAGYATKKDETMRNVGNEYESRGFYSSGIRQQEQAAEAGKLDYQMQMEDAARTDALQNANRGAQNQLAELGQRRAEEEIAARTRVNERRAKQTYDPTNAG